MKGERLKEIVHHITSYTRILQLSLSTLSLGELWIYRQSQEMILAEVQRINRDIRATEIFSGRTETRTRNIRELPLISTPQLDMPPADGEARSFLAKEIREWRETAEYGLGCFVFFFQDRSWEQEWPNQESLSSLALLHAQHLYCK